jgi:hypothetical protein
MPDNLQLYKRYGSVLIGVSAVLHNAIYPGIETLFITSVLIYGWWITTTFSITLENLNRHTVSTVMIAGMSLFHFLLPMPLLLLDGHALTFNLRVPIQTFLHHGLFVTTIVATHIFYTWAAAGNNPFRNALAGFGFYNQPSNKVIWMTSYAGLAATFYNYFIFGANSAEFSDRSPLFYLSSILAQYIWMPVIILLSRFRGEAQNEDKNQYPHIAIYFAVVVLVALSSNMRTLLFSGIATIGSLAFIGFLLGIYKSNHIFTTKRVVGALIAILLLSGPVVDLGYAMIAVRGERANISAGELIDKTIDIYNDKTALTAFKSSVQNENSGGASNILSWDEKYLDNIIANRYVNFKIADNSIFYANQIGYQSQIMQDEIVAQTFALLPNIVLSAFNYDLNKKADTANYSIGDYLYSTATSNPNVLGSFVISSMPGVGLSIFGYWYLLAVAAIFVVIFAMFDSFATRHGGRVYFSYYFYVMVVLTLNYFNDRHVYTFEFRYILRTYLESTVLFLLTMLIFNTLAGGQYARKGIE